MSLQPGPPQINWETLCGETLKGEQRVIPPLTDILDAGVVSERHAEQIKGMLSFTSKPARPGQISAVPISLSNPGESIEIALSGFEITAINKESGINVVKIQRVEDTDLSELEVPQGTGLVAIVNGTMYPLDQKDLIRSKQFVFNSKTHPGASELVNVPLFVAAPVDPTVVTKDPGHSTVMCFLHPETSISIKLNQNSSRLIRPKGGIDPATVRRIG